MAKKKISTKKKNPPTLDPEGGTVLPSATPPATIGDTADDKKVIIDTLVGYFNEADNNRKSGLNPRDAKWRQNLNLYWNCNDFSQKAAWQAKESMPEVPTYVDRFAAALKEALIATPESFYTVIDPNDKDGDLARTIKRITDSWLSITGRNQVGQLLPYSASFEEQMKLGALMATCSTTTWKNDIPGGRVAVETVDPRFVWLDHTYRNLYRIRRIEIDLHELMTMVTLKDDDGKDIFDVTEINKMVGEMTQTDRLVQQEMTRTGNQIISNRKPVVLDEYIATIVGNDGAMLADRAMFVLANGRYLIRGPEANPFWHGKDWLTYAPLVTAPLSVYGRSYMEDFGSMAKTFTELTNMILDAVHTTSLKAFAVVPGMLMNPNQVAEGLSPNKLFLLEEGNRPEDFAKALDLGTLPPESLAVWKALKQELSEAASLNEIGIGQFAPKGRTSATEIDQTQQSSSALLRSVAQTVETRFLDPQLDLIWKTGLQHCSADNIPAQNAAGPEMWDALYSQRKELIERPITFQARGISQIIQKSQMLKSLLGIMGAISQNPILLQAVMQKIDIDKFVGKLFELSNVDLASLQLSQREQMIKSIAQPMQQAQDAGAQQATLPGGGQQPAPAGTQEVESLAKALGSMGVGKQ